MEGSIRRARAADAPALARLAIDTWRAAYAELLPAALLAGLSLDEREARFRAVVEQPLPRRRIWVAEERGAGGPRISGYSSAGPCRDAGAEEAGEVYALYVAPERWRSGLGRALLARALDHLAREGLAPVSLWVLSDNARARGFYESQGFAVDPGRERVAKQLQAFELDHARYVRP
jgi:ribosomal protein S18 acetylase RimI-like enzyme